MASIGQLRLHLPALAQLGLDDKAALAAVADRAVVVDHMAQIVLAEVAQRALYGLARALAEAAQRRFRNGLGELLQKVKVLKASFVCDDAVQNLQHALCTLTAGNAFAAAFVLRKAGLAKICKEGVDAIGAALRELEAADRKSTRLNSSHGSESRMPSSA